MDTQVMVVTAAGALLALTLLRRVVRYIRNIELAPVSEQWVSEQKRQRES